MKNWVFHKDENSDFFKHIEQKDLTLEASDTLGRLAGMS